MTNSNSSQLPPKWSTDTESSIAKNSGLNSVDFDAATARSVELEAGAPWAAFSMMSDSLRLLGSFALGKEGRLSRNKSAQLCDLMNAWN